MPIDQSLQELDFRARIFETPDLEHEPLTVWGLPIEIWALTGEERATLLKASRGSDGKTDITRLYPNLAIASARYPEGHSRAGQRIFQDGDAGSVNSKNGGILEQIAQVASRLSGLLPNDIEEKKES